jgi:hypothetical protein
MSTKKIEFNVKGIERIKYQGKDEIIPFGDGLYLKLRESSKGWIYRKDVAQSDFAPKEKKRGTYPRFFICSLTYGKDLVCRSTLSTNTRLCTHKLRIE